MTDVDTGKTLYDAQLAIEQDMMLEAESRQQKDYESADSRGEGSASLVGRVYAKSITKMLVDPIERFMNSIQTKEYGRGLLVAKLLVETELEPKMIAWLASKAIINIVSLHKKPVKRTTLYRAVGEIVHDEWRVRRFQNNKYRMALIKKLCKDFDKRSYPTHWRKRTIRNYFDAELVSWEGWTVRQKIQVGRVLVDIFRDTTGYIDEVYDGQRFVPSDELAEAAKKFMTQSSSYFVLYKPMVIPPRPWKQDNLFRGGYISGKLNRYPLVKGSGRKDVDRLQAADLSNVLKSMNTIQETPLRVNGEMLDAVSYAYNVLTELEQVGEIGKLPKCNPLSLPPLPDGFYEDQEVKLEHKKRVFLIHDKNRQDKSRRISVLMTIGIANQFRDYEAIYFPHNLDSRGRAYPLPAFLNPQGPDYSKSILEFSKGKLIETQEQLNWIAIAGANAYGNDKVSLKERIQWVYDNEELILATANNWKHDYRWTRVGEPFAFLRFCFEWLSYKREGLPYISHMPVHIDATCSGLQHYAAMLRDEVGGRSVNLVPGLSRQDIYGDVASKAIQILYAGLETNPVGKVWLDFGIDRKITKRQVMVVPYAGKFSSCLTYTKEAVKEKLAVIGRDKLPFDIDAQEHGVTNPVVILAQAIWQAIDEVVVKGKEAMQWLSKLGSAYARYANSIETDNVFQKRMEWITPDGFPVAHVREDETRNRLTSTFNGTTKLVIFEGNGKLNSRDMGLAIAPNFVHSLDATHMRLTVSKATEYGITDFCTVHDSFAVHAANMPTFVELCVKPTFVAMYEEHDVLQELYDLYSKVIPDLEPPPAKGSLDLRGVLKSEFFFS